MYRFAVEKMIKWKTSKTRKPLILEGARQVGKTWLMKEFGSQTYGNMVYINFESNLQMQNLFSLDLNPERIISGLELYSGKKIDPDDTLIVFDEIQEVPKALTSLKYFCEDAPQYHIVCAGSLLGIALHQGTSFPVGKVDFLYISPMTFREFLLAMGNEQLCRLLESGDWQMMTAFSSTLKNLLKQYYFVGGMPEAVRAFADTGDYQAVRKIQRNILSSYEQDFSKHAPDDIVPRIRLVWDSIPSQLARENRKFLYGLVREGARAKEYETAIMWLSDCGLICRISRTSSGNIPLKAYQDLKSFKLFLLDVGLLGCMTNIDQRIILEGDRLFVEFRGALTEQYVCQQLRAVDNLNIFYYTNDRSSCEVDFVVDTGSEVVPVEVKAEENLRAKSLRTYHERFSPEHCVRTSLSDYRKEEWLINIPLYAI